MTSAVKIELVNLTEGKVAHVFHVNPKSGAHQSHRPIAVLTEVGQVYSGVCTDGAALVVLEVDAPAE